MFYTPEAGVCLFLAKSVPANQDKKGNGQRHLPQTSACACTAGASIRYLVPSNDEAGKAGEEHAPYIGI